MIRYSLTCANDHAFESWFQSANAYDGLVAGGRVACPICGDGKISKGLMAPALRATPKSLDAASADTAAPAPHLNAPDPAVAEALSAMRREVEANSEYVGMKFAAEARAIHDGVAKGRSIWGEARPDDARRLIEDGIAVAPLPFVPTRKVN